MSALGQKQTLDCRPLMSAIHPKADISMSRLKVCERGSEALPNIGRSFAKTNRTGDPGTRSRQEASSPGLRVGLLAKRRGKYREARCGYLWQRGAKAMSIFGSIMGAIFGHGSAQASASPTAAPSAPPAQTVDVAAIVDKAAAAKGEKLAWRTSIVDLMKALDLDSSLTARKELAKELKYTGDTNDSATMNIWLHKQIMVKLAANGGKLPSDIKT
jgi:hypothetical protein